MTDMSVNEGTAPAPQAAPPRPWVILLVDDEPDILTSVKAIVELALPGTHVIAASSGRKGLELLESERIDLIISDFKMPGMDGIEFLYQCRRSHPLIPRLMLTAFADDDLMRRAITDAFVDSFIPKMAAPTEFLNRVKEFLVYRPPSSGPASRLAPPPPGPEELPRRGAP